MEKDLIVAVSSYSSNLKRKSQKGKNDSETWIGF